MCGCRKPRGTLTRALPFLEAVLASAIVKFSPSAAQLERKRSPLTVIRHVQVLEAVAAEHGGVLPTYKWLREHGYSTSYAVMLDNPKQFKHIKTYEQQHAEKYAATAEQKILLPPKVKTLSEYNVKGAHFSPIGLDIDPGMTEQEWMQVGRAISLVRTSAQWWIGDFLQYGFRTYGKKATFDLAQQATGYSRVLLYSCAMIAKKFPPARRVEALTVNHHHAVASIPPAVADRLLAEATEFAYSARQIREMGREECGKKNNRFDRKKIQVTLWRTTYDKLKRRAEGKHIGFFIADIVEAFLTGQPVERYANGRKLVEFKQAIINAQKAGEFDDTASRIAARDAEENAEAE